MRNESIGLCLSGGGHRASIFSLGALLYIVDAERHRDIRTISSVSGGSLTSGFLAIQKPLQEMSPVEFDACAATWANQIAGSPAWWRIALGGHVVLFASWTLFVCLGWGWLAFLAPLSAYALPWWSIQATYLTAVSVWAFLVGKRSGGTLWGWSGTWMYVGILGPALFFLIFLWWSPLSWKLRVPLFTIAACVLSLRSLVADLALRATVFGKRQLRSINHAPYHIFCTTEMQTGRHAFFSGDFIYALDAGLGQPADLPISTAVQCSANFPVAFPYRLLFLKKHEFYLEDVSYRRFEQMRFPSLVLSDGGVQDNTGVTWFLDASERNASLKRRFRFRQDPQGFTWYRYPEPVLKKIEGQLASMELASRPDLLVVVNSSFPFSWNEVKFQSIPVLGEILALVRVQAVMYEFRAHEQSRQLHRLFFTNR